VKQYLFLSA